MFLEEFKRLIKSKSSLIILILLIVSAISFFMSNSEKQMFIDQLNEASTDLNKTATAELINGYTGLRFLFNFWFESDFSPVSMYILYVWAGIFLSYTLVVQKENGFGNMIMIRKSYGNAALTVFGAQSLYIFVILAVTTILQVALSFVIGGFGTSVSIGEYQLNFATAGLVIIMQTVIMTLYTVLANGIALFSGAIIKNKYIIQALPLLIFALLPLLAATTIGNLSASFAVISGYFLPENVFYAISNVFQSSFDSTEICYNILPVIVYIVILIILFVINARKNSRNYV